jgi:hypothetical protein
MPLPWNEQGVHRPKTTEQQPDANKLIQRSVWQKLAQALDDLFGQ